MHACMRNCKYTCASKPGHLPPGIRTCVALFGCLYPPCPHGARTPVSSRAASPPRPRPRALRFRARAPVKSPSSRSAFVHAEGTKVPSLTRNEYTSKHATGRKRYRPVPTVAHRWAAGLGSPLAEQGRVRGSRSHFHAAMRVWVAVLSFFVKGHESRLCARLALIVLLIITV